MITKKVNFTLKYSLFLFISFFFINLSSAKDINIQENINLSFKCDLDKKIIKNSKYNYQSFLAKDLNEKGLDKFEIEAVKPEKLFIDGLSLFLSKSEKLNVKVVNKDVVLFKAFDEEKNYSESAIVTRKSGELIHEITKNVKSENSEKYIFFYSCIRKEKKV
ncbi:hypothetical protein OAR10_00575 [Candidatus Pelagibacter sp.]|jgi:hypothetical protein|nr:hypothetical protein [Candidatus Pelagibacter sp.]